LNRVEVEDKAVIGLNETDFTNRLGDLRYFRGAVAKKVEILGRAMGLPHPDAKQDGSLENEPVA